MAAPQRIVSLVPSHTESLHDLGFADAVVGRTRFCIAPAPWVDSIATVGGTKDASLDKILALQPDLVLADIDENPKALVDELMAAGVEVLWSEIDNVDDAAGWLVELADRCGNRNAGEQAANAVRVALDEVRRKDAVPVFCPIWHDPWMTFDATAYPHAMLEAVGFRNVFGGHEGPKYFEVTADDVVQSGAEATLLPTEPFPFHKQRDRVQTGGLGAAGTAERVQVIDGEALTWFGTRTAPGLRVLAAVRDRFD